MTEHESYCQLCGGACALATPPTPEQAGPSRLPRHLIESLIREHQDGTAEKDERAWRSDAVCLLQGLLTASALASPGAMEGAQAAQPTAAAIWQGGFDEGVEWIRASEVGSYRAPPSNPYLAK